MGVRKVHNEDCAEHTFLLGTEEITWPDTPSGDEWIASNCLDSSRRLIFRQCSGDTWIPDNTDTEARCVERTFAGEINVCPYGFQSATIQGSPGSSPQTLCFSMEFSSSNRTRCVQGNVFYMDLNFEQREQLITQGIPKISHQLYDQTAMIQSGRNLNSLYDENGDFEIQDTKCGRFGLSLKLNKSEVEFHCDDDICDDMCLSVNVTKEPLAASLTIEPCSSRILAIFKKPFINHSFCPPGYYAADYQPVTSSRAYACMSIELFSNPIPIEEVSDTEVKRSCSGSIMSLNKHDDMFMFMQLAHEINLQPGNSCLFSPTPTTSRIVTYSEWSTVDHATIDSHNLNWDRSMDYGRISDTDVVSYLAVKPNGEWTWEMFQVSCIFCVVEVVHEYPQMTLRYSLSAGLFHLTLRFSEFLYREKESDLGFFCQAKIGDVYKSDLKVSMSDTPEHYFVEFVGGGEYWCSGHTRKSGISYLCTNDILDTGIVYVFEVEAPSAASNKELVAFVNFFQTEYTFVKVVDSAVLLEAKESNAPFTFIFHLSLDLLDGIEIISDASLLKLTQYQTEVLYIYERLNQYRAYDETSEIFIKSVSLTEFCFHGSILSVEAIIWDIGNINETIFTSPLCFSDESNSRISRTCLGDPIYGAHWKDLVNASNCQSSVSDSILDLYGSLGDSGTNEDVVKNLSSILKDSLEVVLPLDVYLTSRIIERISNETFDDLGDIFEIYNSLQMIDERYLNISTSLNSTDILLEALDEILFGYVESTVDDVRRSSPTVESPLLQTFVLYPDSSGISGVALYKPKRAEGEDNDFTEYSSRFIYPNETFDEIFTNHSDGKDLIIGSYFPSDLLKNYPDITLVMTFFFTEKLFQSKSGKYFNSDGKVLSITILPEDDYSHLPSPLPIFFNYNETEDACRYWSFELTEWSSEGCFHAGIFTENSQQITLCECTHLTHYGCLISYNNMNKMFEIDEVHESALSMITIVGCSLSLCGTFGIFVTAFTFENWPEEITWPDTPSGDEWIASNCLDSSRRLIFRQCSGDTWIPDNTDTEARCVERTFAGEINVCPYGFQSATI
ncbi:Adhesion G-protein coupled receptor G7, partial [Pseudolycoriella hygida]